ncbi:MAG: ATP-dependent helicase [Candidatus Limivicinus sp.]|nr:ATP-dependent helicase [Clostridiales bacterium]MDY6132462.1 ATP-dependent helicase [Candidatus Limivicinus sp.]
MDYRGFAEKYALKLNRQQEEAVRSVEGNVLLLAVPGSGKTTVLVARLGYALYCLGVAPENILTMTYTVAAAADMRKRFVSLFGEELSGRLAFRTINGVCARIIRQYEQSRGTTAFELLSDESRIAAMLGDICRGVLNEYPADSDIKAIRTKITYVKNMCLKPEEIEALNQEIKGFPSIYRAYVDTMKRQRLMDYDDQLVYAYNILRRCPDILHSLQSRYRYICVDEAQDTSKIQHMIIELLAGPEGNLFMVGDEDQSIYGFRAAYPRALADFSRRRKNARVLLMEQNYRSTRQIVRAADRFIQQNSDRHPKHMTAVRGDGAEVKELTVSSRAGQYAYLLKTAKDCGQETAVLFRDNECALPLIDLLDRSRIPYRCRQMDTSFFTSPVVRDITDIIRFALDQTDGQLFMNLYYKLNARLSKQEAQEAVRRCPESMSVLEYLAEDFPLSGFKRKQCRALLTHMNNMLTENAGSAVYRIVKYMGYGAYLKQREMGEGKAEILQALGNQEPSPARLLDRLDELSGIIRSHESNDSRFILSTIHSSKGLEYDRVFLMDTIDGILPSQAADEDRALMEEERRLFYVGMTRAKNELNIFTFRQAELSSAFSAALFPGKEEKPAAPKGGGAPSIRPPSAGSSLHWAAKDYFPGVRVCHRQFGKGQIITRNEDILTVRFEQGESRKLSLSVCLKAGSLWLDR